MVAVFAFLQCVLSSVKDMVQQWLGRRGEQGQATAEYALVVLGAAFVAFLVVSWARGTGSIGKLLDAVLEQVMDKVR